MNYNQTIKNSKMTQVNNAFGASCVLKFYSGSMPANVGTLSGNNELASFTGSSIAFGNVANGSGTTVTLSANVSGGGCNFASGVNAIYTAVATFARVLQGGVAQADLTVGAAGSGADVIVSNTTFTSGSPVTISSIVITAGN